MWIKQGHTLLQKLTCRNPVEKQPQRGYNIRQFLKDIDLWSLKMQMIASQTKIQMLEKSWTRQEVPSL
jgi:hypothetical protein